MKRLLLGLTALFLSACNHIASDEMQLATSCYPNRKVVENLTQVPGQVEEVAGNIVVTFGERRYTFCNLPQNVTTKGQKLVFDAKVYEIFPNERLMGDPAEIVKIY